MNRINRITTTDITFATDGQSDYPAHYVPGLEPYGVVGADQPIYTAIGPIVASDLARRADFVKIAYDRSLRRYSARRAWVLPVGPGPLVYLRTDKGTFRVSPTATVGLNVAGEDGARGEVQTLQPGRRLFACRITRHVNGYPRVQLRDGRQGQELLHRLVARDVCGFDVDGRVIHHVNEDKLDNRPENLHVYHNQSEHARDHMLKLSAEGKNPSQIRARRARKRNAAPDRAPEPGASVRERSLEVGRRLRDAGHSFGTPTEYLEAYRAVFGRGPVPPFTGFDTLQAFVDALDRENHSVVEVGCARVGERFLVMVSGTHGRDPVTIWPVESVTPFGSGLVIDGL